MVLERPPLLLLLPRRLRLPKPLPRRLPRLPLLRLRPPRSR